ncbi:aminotransferase, class I/II [Fibrobacter succinogenes subsp. succinogenes S85]|uniref:Aminotransferase class I and II n=1 Tax=Fibrobacter succinogenes (strain ATCC 19169 / S85) TaxID=59374 RepID=C9RKZ9_FIBSS|nr:pyridoxal phosphate-dependent aminotransferase [Fibrobacter succinogenes]ACX75947.1 aminotransferase class I and II [Fibrobacter succinogenes subsp. succinogenes S85]ADL27319.1 aminotransferase, class I/II [Fibrobacter succinogenes subsp. succinogenes S85]
MLSSRLPKDLSPSPFFAELERAKADVLAECAEANSLPFIDMTVSSPVKAGLPVDLDDAVDEGRKAFGNWSPDAAGWKSAREAVVEYYRQRGGNFTAGQIILTASTSEAYSVLFKTFCDPGDVILTPMPGYPLLDTLAQLEHLECAPYFLKLKRERFDKLTDLKKVTERRSAPAEVNAFRFVLDSDSLLAAPERAKILLLVSPHNPTGHCISREEWNEAVRFCEENNMILVVDEVFGDYAFSDKVSRTWQYVFDSCHPERNEVESMDLWDAGGGDFINLPEDGPKCPIFWLNGLSKAVGSPQLKLGWMAFYAPRENFEEIRAALEFVEDAYLSVSAPAQALGISLLPKASAYESKVLDRLQQNWQTLREAFPSKYCPEVLGGWYAVVRLGDDDEELTLRLLREKHVLVQPGFFFDFDEDGWVVMSLLQDPAIFKEAIQRIKQ